MAEPTTLSCVVLTRTQVVPGCLDGLTQPSLLAWVQVNNGLCGALDWAGLGEVLASHLPSVGDLGGGQELKGLLPSKLPAESADVLHFMVSWVAWLQEAAGLPILDFAHVMPGSISTGGPDLTRCVLIVPSLAPRAAALALAWLVRWAGDSQVDTATLAMSTSRQAELKELLGALGRLAPGGKNNRTLLRAAHQLGMPVLVLPMGVIQYGWGRRGRWMESTFTDATPNISARLARGKPWATALLRQAGLPVSDHEVVTSLDAALQVARRLGYPVVVKPSDQDGGVGVSAGLMNDDELRAGFERALPFSPNIIVEKHAPGRDYRLDVFNGKVLWATERVPAGVTGDGVSTIQALLDEVNRDPRRRAQSWSLMKPITINQEAQELLEAASMTLESVPAAGRFVQLRRSANVSSGGTPLAVMDRVHPDNARLAERAANALRLDVAGVDVLMPDISTSWLESTAAICEVNGQPQFGPRSPIHAQILAGLVSADGRVPVVVLLTARGGDGLLGQTAEILAGHARVLGYSTSGGLVAGRNPIRLGRRSPSGDARALMMDRSVDAIIVATDGQEWLRNGLPFDRFDIIAVDQGFGESPGGNSPKVLALLQPHCTTVIGLPVMHPLNQVVSRMFPGSFVRRSGALQLDAVDLARWILECEERHASANAPDAAHREAGARAP